MMKMINFWRKDKKKDETLDKILHLMKIMDVKIAKNETEIEVIKLKMRKKVYKQSEEQEIQKQIVKYDDGFDELRKFNNG